MAEPTVTLDKTFSQADFDRFAQISGDDNPIHVDADYASRTRFGRTVAHGILLASVLRGLLDRLSPGARVASQQLKFPAPTYAGEALHFSAHADEPNARGLSVRLCCARVADSVVTCEGVAILRVGITA